MIKGVFEENRDQKGNKRVLAKALKFCLFSECIKRYQKGFAVIEGC